MMRAADADWVDADFAIEDITTGLDASGFGRVGDGRVFSFHVHQGNLLVEVYRPRLTGLVPHAEDVAAVSTRSIDHIDVSDARSLSAAVRDAVADAQPVPRSAR